MFKGHGAKVLVKITTKFCNRTGIMSEIIATCTRNSLKITTDVRTLVKILVRDATFAKFGGDLQSNISSM